MQLKVLRVNFCEGIKREKKQRLKFEGRKNGEYILKEDLLKVEKVQSPRRGRKRTEG